MGWVERVFVSASQAGPDWSAVLTRELREAVNARINVEVRPLHEGSAGEEAAREELLAQGAAVVLVEVSGPHPSRVLIRVRTPGEERWKRREAEFADQDPEHERVRAARTQAEALKSERP